MTGFTPGQRWVSDSESELGLGTVLSQDARLVGGPRAAPQTLYKCHTTEGPPALARAALWGLVC